MRILSLLAKLAITVGLLAYLFFQIETEKVLAQLGQCDPRILAAGTLLLSLLPALGAMRWRAIMSCLGPAPRFLAVLRWTYVSVFFGQVLPATVGSDALRMWLAYRDGGGARLAVNSVGLDRVVMTLMLAVLVAAVAPGLGNLTGASRLRYLTLLFLGATAVGLGLVMLGDRLPERLRQSRLWRAIGLLAHDARRLFLSWRHLGGVLALTFSTYCGIFASVGLFALAFGAAFEWWSLMVLLPPVLFVSMLPISIGGWGTREMAMVLALGSIDIGPSTAVLVSLWLGAASILISLPGGILYLTRRTPLKPADAAELAAPR